LEYYVVLYLTNIRDPMVICFPAQEIREEFVSVIRCCIEYTTKCNEVKENRTVEFYKELETNGASGSNTRFMMGMPCSIMSGRFVKRNCEVEVSFDHSDLILTHQDGSVFFFPLILVLELDSSRHCLDFLKNRFVLQQVETVGLLQAMKEPTAVTSPTATNRSGATTGSVATPKPNGIGRATLDALGDKMSPRMGGRKSPSIVTSPNSVIDQIDLASASSLGFSVVVRFKEFGAPVTLVFDEEQFQKEFCVLVRAIQKVNHGRVALWKDV